MFRSVIIILLIFAALNPPSVPTVSHSHAFYYYDNFLIISNFSLLQVFIVRASSKPASMALSIRLPANYNMDTDHYLIEDAVQWRHSSRGLTARLRLLAFPARVLLQTRVSEKIAFSLFHFNFHCINNIILAVDHQNLNYVHKYWLYYENVGVQSGMSRKPFQIFANRFGTNERKYEFMSWRPAKFIQYKVFVSSR